MKKGKQNELRPEYRRGDLEKKGERGKHLRAYRAGNNLVLLEPRVAAAFPTDRSVNDALNSLIKITEHTKRYRRGRGQRSRAAST